MRKVAIVGASGAGKTRLVARLVQALKRKAIRVGTLKHAHGGFEMDRRGKDSYKHFEAGADVTSVTSPNRTAVFRRHRGPLPSRRLWQPFSGCDIVLVEGFRGRRLPHIEVFRRRVSKRPLFETEGFPVRAVVTRDPVDTRAPVFDPEDIRGLTAFILKKYGPR